jgi:hypothetical protein
MAVMPADQDQAPASPHVLASVTLQHKWIDRVPRPLYGKSMRVPYRLRSDDAVTRQLVGVDDPTGNPIAAPHRTFAFLDWTEQQERGGREGKGRLVVLKVSGPADAEAALLGWLKGVGLKPEGGDALD